MSLVYPHAIDFAAQPDEWQQEQREFARMYARETAQLQLYIQKTLMLMLKRAM